MTVVRVREKPPLRLHTTIKTASGRTYRWGEDDPNPANVPSGLRFGDVAPGGFDTCDQVLPRKAGLDYSDLELLGTLTVRGAGGDVAGQYRLERAPRVSGDQLAVSPNAVGWQAHLDDQKVTALFVDGDLSHWVPASRTYKAVLLAFDLADVVLDPSVEPDPTTGLPALLLSISGAASKPWAEANYDAGPGNTIASIYYDFSPAGYDTADTVFAAYVGVMDDDIHTNAAITSDLAAAAASATYTPATARRWGVTYFQYPKILTGDIDRRASFRSLRVYGNTGLTKRGTEPAAGYYASDLIGYTIGNWCPAIGYTADTVDTSSFVIPQAAFLDPVTPSEIIRYANSFELFDWYVWEGPLFYYHARGARGRNWRARVWPSQLEETGPQVDRLWNGVIVRYQDVDGSARTVGPTDANVNTEDATLMDTDPANPANAAGINRYALLDMGKVSTSAAAIRVGYQFLSEARQLDRSGQAKIVGWVEDDHGVTHPYWRIRAGDTISFVDAADTSARRVVKTDKDHASRTCTVDLDAPPEGLDAVLERLGVVLVGLGV